ncbi:hypothetical protein SAMN04488023_11040 [Pedobacter rhizosphaerae]|uniref:Uncharacterized protein n=1 Tax=Pedobacter rhizosphaerae TaxID=390241 RepID=A0A1H9PNL4_9SPHI|nr:hypothetical protein SAMN04488023_11040 [Pedobacter rhizosphaerae]
MQTGEAKVFGRRKIYNKYLKNIKGYSSKIRDRKEFKFRIMYVVLV